MKILSVAVPSYNSAEYLYKAVDSLVKGGDRMEVIIINDGSKDDTGRIADEYAAKYPEIVKVVHQENKGHGGGINSGIAAATGKYFKVVDSDDTLNEECLLKTLDVLENNDVDMFVTNYKYTHEDPKDDRVIRYSALPKDKISTWDDIGTFKVHQYLTIHSVAYKTEVVRESGVVLPEHVFYEDNTFICTVLPFVKTFIYMDMPLYNYTIGREGQSVQEDVMKRRYKHQLLTAEMIFCSTNMDSIESKKLKKLMWHEIIMMTVIGVVYARMNKTEEAENDVKALYKKMEEHDKKWAKKLQRSTLAFWVSIPGPLGRGLGLFGYRLTQKLLKFNT